MGEASWKRSVADGWKCPACARSWAPHVDQCRVCEQAIGTPVSPPPTPPVAKAEPTIAELWEQWKPIAEREMAVETWRTASNHRRVWARTPLLLDDGREVALPALPWDQITPRTAEVYRATRERVEKAPGRYIAASTVNRELCTLQSLLNYFVRIRKSIAYHPMIGWGRVDEQQFARKTYLTDEQAKKFIEAGTPLFQDIATLALRCVGMRQSEARLLRKSEVDWEQRVINLPSKRNKNRRARVIPFPSDVEGILRSNCDRSRGPHVFVNPRDPKRLEPIGAPCWQYWLRKAREASGVSGFDGESIVTHHLRHKAVTDLLQAGEPANAVMAAAGMSPETLRRYSKFGPDQQDSMRSRLERMVEPPTEITAGLKGPGQRPAKRATLTVAPRATSAVEE